MAGGRRRRPRAICWWWVLISVAVILAVWGRARLVSPLVSTVAAEPVRYEVRADFTGFSVYRESVLFAPLSGHITPLVEDGELVPRNAAVARLENPDAAAAYRERLDSLLLEAEAWREMREEDLAAAAERARAGGEEVFNAALELKRDGGADRLGQAVLGLSSARQEVVSLLAGWSERVQAVENLRSLAERMEDRIRSPRAGIVRTGLDGLEDILKWDAPLTVRLAEELERRVAEGVPVLYSEGEITAGAPAVRILDPGEIEAILLLAPEDVAPVDSGESVRIEVRGAEVVVDAQVREIGPGGGQGVLARVSLVQAPPFFFRNRMWEGTVTTAAVSGLSVPPSSLVERADGVGLFARAEGRLRWTPVEVLIHNECEAVVEGISAGLEVVADPRLLVLLRLR